MKKSVVFVAIVTAVASITFSAAADEERHTVLYFANSVTMPISPKGVGLAPTIAETFALGIPVGKKLSLIPEAGISTGFTVFQPNLQVLFSVSGAVTKNFSLGGTVSYRYTPHWEGTQSDAHTIGVFVTPLVKLPAGILLVFPVGVGYNATTKTASIPISFKLAFPLPI